MIICVYGITSAVALPRGATGMSREALRLIRRNGIGAIVGTLPRRSTPTRANLQRYAAAHDRLAARLGSLLPARFGTFVSDPTELDFILASRTRALREALRRVRGRVQMTVRLPATVTSSENPSAQAFDASHPATTSNSLRGMPPGTAYLQARAAMAAAAANVTSFAPLRPSVRRWVRGEHGETRGNRATVYHLVPRRSASAYRLALERAAGRAGVPLTVTGPWPAYAFTDI